MMGLFADQAQRLLKRNWSDAQMLAEELYSMFTADSPVVFDSPVEIQNPYNAPAITITQSPEAAPGIPPIFVQPPTPESGFFTTDPVVIGDGGPVGPRTTAPPTQEQGGTTSGSGRFTIVAFDATERHDFSGTITGGTGATYQIALEDNIRDRVATAGQYTINAPSTVTATMRQAADDAQWPAGTYVQTVTRLRQVRVVRRTEFTSSGAVRSIVDSRTVISEDWVFQLPVWL